MNILIPPYDCECVQEELKDPRQVCNHMRDELIGGGWGLKGKELRQQGRLTGPGSSDRRLAVRHITSWAFSFSVEKSAIFDSESRLHGTKRVTVQLHGQPADPRCLGSLCIFHLLA